MSEVQWGVTVDYVVYGTGYGATLMLLGYALRTWGPKLRFADHDEGAYDRREFQTAQASWSRFTSGLGATIATAGAVLVLFTFVLMFVNPGDSVGVMVALIISAATLIGVAVWAWLYFSRYGTWGILATPEPLSHYQPVQYQTSVQPVTSASDADATSAEPSAETDDDTGEHDEDPYGTDDDFRARFSKYESHHPDGEIHVGAAPEDKTDAPDEKVETDDSGAGETATTAADDADPEATLDIEDQDKSSDVEDDEKASDVEDVAVVVADATEADEPAGEDEADKDEAPPADDNAAETVASAGEDEVEVSTPATSVTEAATDLTTDEGSAEDPAPDVLPEAHEPGENFTEDSGLSDAGLPEDGEERDAGGREEALRRLRERRAQRDSSSDDDSR